VNSDRKNKREKIVILGRGESLALLRNASYPRGTEVLLVNIFWKSTQTPHPYYKDPVIRAFLKGKHVRLICNPFCETKYILPFLLRLRVSEAYQIGYEGDPKERPPKRFFRHLPIEWYERWMPLKHNYREVGSLGAAFVYAVEVLKKKEVDIFGLDFYERDYYLTNTHDFHVELTRSSEIKKVWRAFFRNFEDIEVNINTLAEFRM
jgi:hypothetical protein